MDAALPVVEPMALVHDRYAVHVGCVGPRYSEHHSRECQRVAESSGILFVSVWKAVARAEKRLEPCARTVPTAFLAALH